MLNLNEIIAQTLANGGGTFPAVEDGYMVGGVVPERTCTPEEFERVLYDFVAEHGHNLGGAHIGTWIDNGVVYLDVSENVADQEEALNLARERGERAIYDIRNGESIFVE